MSVHKENSFELEICEHLAANGWLYADRDFEAYDRARALFPEDVIGWVKDAYPRAWETLEKNHGSSAADTLLDRVRQSLDQSNTLDVLRHGIDLLGVQKKVRLAEFKPASGINPDILARYGKNRLRVVRQVRYSLHSENSIDLVLFLNGVPVATVELKTDFTQSVEDAVWQYKQDRAPKTAGKGVEPLLSFPSGALVHFAVSNKLVRMATELEGMNTRFLPFDQGDGGAAGNPVNPDGHRTAYLWEWVWERDGWLEIVGRYMIAERDEKKKVEKILFPRFHQLDATRALRAAVQRDGPGGRYLIQHSAGSGKTNSIAWSAHFLADLHDELNEKVFDSVLVVSDRKVIDGQLQDAIFGFERTTGVVATIRGEKGSKSEELAEALGGDKKIVVCTIQTFPFALEKVRELAATQGKRFAVIADEAHSSQSGEAASKLKAVLSDRELEELADGGEVTIDDVLAAEMKARATEDGITFVAFTATPKAKTIELFGTRPDPNRKPAADNVPTPFHVYSMQQAIEEGFILDVLKNYTTYSLAFKLAQEGQEFDEKQVEKSAAMRKVMSWVRLHPYNISQKVKVVVEHFREQVAPLLGGRAKAMVVVTSRKEAVRWKLAIDAYISENGYGLGTMVAFSGEVRDKESGPEPFTEKSASMNPRLKGKDIREAFKADEYQLLLVANKFQTGFDQPLLCGIYVDKRLAGIQAVQTLSRLNRAYPGKDTVYVLDFVNSSEEVLEAFKTYHQTAELSATTDPNLVFKLRTKLDGAGYYDDHEVDRVVKVEMKPGAKQSELVKAIEPVVDRLVKRYKAAQAQATAARGDGQEDAAALAAESEVEALTLFKRDMGTYIRVYTFISQIFDYGNTEIEKRAIFYRRLLPLLEFDSEREGVDLSKVVLTHYQFRSAGRRAMALGDGDRPQLRPLEDGGSGEVRDKQRALLEEIIERVNDLFDGELTENDKLVYVNNVIKGKLMESEVLRQQAMSNTKQQFASSPDLHRELMSAIMSTLDAHHAMSTQALNSGRVQAGLKEVLLGPAGLYESLRMLIGERPS